MYIKLPLGNLNPSPYPPHLTNTYTYKVTIMPKVCNLLPKPNEKNGITSYGLIENDSMVS